MKNNPSEYDENSPIEIAASEWLPRLDRSLTPEEQDSYSEWLAQDAAHGEAMGRYLNGWDDFDRLAGLHLKHHARIAPYLLLPENLPPRKSRRLVQNIVLFSALPFAALIALILYFTLSNPEDSSGLKVQPALELLARIEQRTLKDGSVVELNRGSIVRSSYTESERRVYLTKGEANFYVAKDPDRPFIVNVAGVDVRAVGTIFSIKLSKYEVDVIVTEGIVNVKRSFSSFITEQPTADSYLEIGQRARVDLRTEFPVIEVTTIGGTEIDEAHRWKPRLLDYDEVFLGKLVEEFNRSNLIQIAFHDPSLENISLSCSFWSDNVEGFIRLMETSFGMEAEWSGSREIVLREAE